VTEHRGNEKQEPSQPDHPTTFSAEHEPEKTRGLPIKWQIPEDLISRYATNLVVQHTEHEFTISFFEAEPPILLGTPEDSTLAIQESTLCRPGKSGQAPSGNSVKSGGEVDITT